MTECLLTPSSRPQSPALTLLLEDEACWLRTLPQPLAEAEASAEIYRKGWYPGASLTASGGGVVLFLGRPLKANQPAWATAAMPHQCQSGAGQVCPGMGSSPQ